MPAKILWFITLFALICFQSHQTQQLDRVQITTPPDIFAQDPAIAAGDIDFSIVAPAAITMTVDLLDAGGSSVGTDSGQNGDTVTISATDAVAFVKVTTSSTTEVIEYSLTMTPSGGSSTTIATDKAIIDGKALIEYTTPTTTTAQSY